jgi:LPXTG-motif cell wall-anchored protein
MQGMFSKRIAAVLTAIFLVMFQLTSLYSHPVSAAALKNAAMITVVDVSGKTIIPQTVMELKQGETAFDVLKDATSKKNVAFEYSTDPKYGASITKIGESKPDYNKDSTYWAFGINGGMAAVGVSGYTVENGDDLLFKVISYPAKTVSAKVSAKDLKGNAIIPETAVSIIDGANAYDALIQAAKIKNLKLNVSIDSSYFEYVQNIGDTKLVDGDYWKTSMNGKGLESSLSTNLIHNGDSVQLNLDNYLNPPDSNSDNGNNSPGNGSDDKGNNGGSQLPNVSNKQVLSAIKSTSSYVLKNGSIDEFEAVGLKKSGQSVPSTYLDNIKKSLKENDGTFRNVTDYERLVIGISAAGGNAANIEGYNLIKKIYSNERMTNQGTNGIVYALLAVDSHKYEVPSNAKWTREKLVNYLVDHQLKDGGWSLVGVSPSVDITAMALAALAPYKKQENVINAIEKATNWLSSMQNANGGFSSTINGGDASETTAQVMIGLSAIGIDPTNKLFTKANGNLLQHLMAFQQKDGGFAHITTDKTSNLIATTQALLALTAYQQFLNGAGSVYQFTGNYVSNGNNDNTTNHSQKHSDGQVLPNTATNNYNILAIGVILLIAGGFIYFNSRKKRVA